MNSYRLDYIAADTAAGIELVADSREFDDRNDASAMREATRLVKAWGAPRASTERRTGRLWALHRGNKTLVGNVWQ
ncbi:hypothetical protein [Embleya hyalina]|uniref:Uncharacterized protein n=1 Tax=Embleya hyalina TaxID=516124 RepID=A0A401YYT8_9ACTN|nr:hypothetical protein [Embleya hyalina]GCD99753.1 hypothetical protein EHYA_07475 [Embleya hyalina]